MTSRTSSSRLTAHRRVELPDGSVGTIERYNDAYFIAAREVDGHGVWAQVFRPTDDSGGPAATAARLLALEDELIADFTARPGDFDRRPIHCVVCGAANERGCEHQPAGFRP